MTPQRKSSSLIALGLIAAISVLASQVDASFPYYGTKIGALKRLHHGVSGDVYAVDSRTLFVKNFNYDGEAPAAYFYVGNTNKPSNDGALRVRDERGGSASLTRRYRNKDITLSLPEGKTLRDIKWFSVWCDEFAVNFGDVSIPNNLDFPRPQKITALKGVHGVGSENIVIVDAQTLLVPNFSYDGEAPDAKFWVGRGQHPSPQGLRIPDENGKEDPLRRYDKKTIVLTLPGDLTIFDIGHFGVWCEAFTVDFGHVTIPEGLNVPPSLKMLGISPQSKLNCEVLYDDLAFEVRWAVAGESIVVQLVAKLAKNEYMSFGISPDRDHSVMIGSDVVVAWVDQETGKGYAHDYYLEDKSQCSGHRGTCPDVNILENTNSIRLLNAAMVNGYSIVTYQRSLQATDKLDLPISVNGTFEAIVWAIGPLNERKEASFHSQYLKRTHYIDFGRQPTWNCPMPEDKSAAQTDDSDDSGGEEDDSQTGYPPSKSKEPEEEYYENRPLALKRPSTTSERSRPVPTPKPVTTNDGAWDIPAIQCHEPEDGVFYAQMGPTGGKHGYPAITGHVGWGISWYINGLLIPEIHVVRGKTYTFVVEGGNNPDIPAKYHPFYITDDPVGGYEHKRDEEKKAVRIFAGVHRSRSNQITPTGVGRLCNWTPDVDGPPADDYHSFGAYQRTLTLQCDSGEPGVITWKPDKNTPDTVYYHCFTHRYLGWKIHVHDACDADRYAGAASDKHEVRVRPSAVDDDFAAASSARHETKVSPNANFLLKHQSDLIKNHNMNGTPPKLTFEITKSSEITKLISDGIRAAEALEESIVRNSTPPLSTSASNSIHHAPHAPPPRHHHQSNGKVQPKGPSPPASEVSSNSQQVADQTVPGAGLIGETIVPQRPLQPPLPPNQQLHAHTHAHAHAHQPSSPPSNTVIAHANNSPPPPPPPSTPVIHHSLKAQSHLSHKHPLLNLTNQKTIGLSDYLRPPQNAPLFKLPGRRPYPVFVKAKLPPPKVVLPQQLPRHPAAAALPAGPLPQPSLIVNHYRRPVAMPALLKPFRYEKPFPMPAAAMGAAPILMLGQPTMLVHPQKMDSHAYAKPKPVIPVPYGDLMPQASYAVERKPGEAVKAAKPNAVADKKPVAAAPVTPAPVFKKPFDVHQVKEEPSQVASMQPAVNIGFKPDSVVVESGFRPIIRDGIKLPEDQVAHRREDTASEIDEAMETDTLFLTAQQGPQNFEPMFIPSPPDSMNDTIIVRKNVASPPHGLTANATEHPQQHGPVADELRNATIEEEPKPNRMDAHYDGAVEKVPATGDKSEKEFLEGDNYGNTIERFMDKLKMELQEDDEFGQEEEDDLDPLEDNEDSADYDDRVAAAAERIDTYYLPPDNRKVPPAHVPVGTAFTYDGKAVVDSSLVVPPKLDGSSDAHAQRHGPGGLSKLEQFIRTTPQFQPFRGEIPPQVAEYTETPPTPSIGPLFSTDSSPSSLGGPLNLFSSPTHTSPSSLASPRPISTKLQIVQKST